MGFAACGRALAGRALHRWCASLPVCLLALAGLALLLPGAARAEAVLRVLAWPDYADPDFVAVFEKRHGVKVEITIVASDTWSARSVSGRARERRSSIMISLFDA